MGIDTGGTYTDAVLFDFEKEEVLKGNKALTTKEDLNIGINEVLSKFSDDILAQVQLVSLSTTLATNACVENKGGRGLLILMGYDHDILREYGHKYGLPSGNGNIVLVSGSHSQTGEVVQQPDWNRLREIVEEYKDRIDAFGIAEYWGIRNPEFEKQAKELIMDATGLPVVCAHELSGEINSLRRAASTLLNARLIPLTDGLMKAVKKSLEQRNIKAPLMIVRGDGSLMSERFAKEKPVETLLSGPAASVVGGMKLSGTNECIILDMGGTTSDLAIVRDGRMALAEEGVDIGEWRTATQAIEVKTMGLGGDSLIAFDKFEQLTIGPRKAAPLSWLVHRYPETRTELERIAREKRWYTISLIQFFYIIRDVSGNIPLSKDEASILNALKDGPKSIEQLSAMVDVLPYFLDTERLESLGVIGRSSLTPTDFMHITGSYSPWDKKAALMGAKAMAHRLGMGLETLIKRVEERVEAMLFSMISNRLLDRAWKRKIGGLNEQAHRLLMMGFSQDCQEFVCKFNTPLALVSIGAPTHVYLPRVAEKFGTRCVVPEDAAVANAVGAITGSIVAEETVIIKPRYEVAGITGYGCHSSADYKEFEDYEPALQWAIDHGRHQAKTIALSMGAKEVEVIVDHKEQVADLGEEKEDGILLEGRVVVRAIGKAAI